MCFTGDDVYHNFSIFAPMLSSLILDSNTKLLTGYRVEYHLKKNKSFDTNLEPTICNLANSSVILKVNNKSVLVQKSLHCNSSLYRNFILNFYIIY